MFHKRYVDLTYQEQIELAKYIRDVTNPQWKQIIVNGFNTGYRVNNIGDIINSSGNIIKRYQSKEEWYYTVNLGSKFGLQTIHRLVAQAFIPNPENKPQVNHINGDKTFNWVGNLEWVTAKENAEHAWAHKLVNNAGENQGLSIYTNNQIEEVCKLLEKGLSYKEIEAKTAVKAETISNIRMKTSWKIISDKYAFNTNPKQPRYTDEMIHSVCKLLEDPTISHKDISQKTNVDIDTIKDIMKKTSYKRISDEYKICKRINSSQYSPLSKYTESQIHQVCKMLQDQKPMKEISEVTGVKISSVYDVKYGKNGNLYQIYINLKQMKYKVQRLFRKEVHIKPMDVEVVY